jgi:hypothetical protein
MPVLITCERKHRVSALPSCKLKAVKNKAQVLRVYGSVSLFSSKKIPAFGRNVPYMTSFGLSVISCVPPALVKHYPGLLVLRFLVRFMSSLRLTIGVATMQDMVYSFYTIYNANKRSTQYSNFPTPLLHGYRPLSTILPSAP